MDGGADGSVGGAEMTDRPAPLFIPPPTYTLIGGSATFWLHATFAPAWFADATREARVTGPDARRREILFAVCFVESYLLEWVRDDVLKREFRAVDKYLPADDRQGITDRWKTVTKMLNADGRIAAHPDYLRSAVWRDFLRVVGFRDGLVHGRTGRPQTGDTPPDARPTPTISDLGQMLPGWPTGVVVALVRELHDCAGTTPPAWLDRTPSDPPAAPASLPPLPRQEPRTDA